MTSEALAVISAIFPHEVLMGVMTCNAADSGISSLEALAVRQAVGLKTNVDLSAPAAAYHRLPSSMALPAKIGDVLRCDLPQVWRRRVIGIALQCCHQVSVGPSMAMLAGDTRRKRIQVQPAHR